MATYRTTMFVAVPPEAAFDYVCDFRHATWDPRVSSARRTDGNGAIGVGAGFELRSPTPFGTIVFPYRVVLFERPWRVALQGTTWFASYTDTISCAPFRGGTLLTYDARFDLRGLLRLGAPLVRRLFSRVGDEATRGIPPAIERSVTPV